MMSRDDLEKIREQFNQLSLEDQIKEKDKILSAQNILQIYTTYLNEIEILEEKAEKVKRGEDQFSDEEINSFYKKMQVLDKIGFTFETKRNVPEYALKFYILAFRFSALEFKYVSTNNDVLKDYRICFDVLCRVAIKLGIPLFSKKIVKYTEGFLVDILNMIYSYKDYEQDAIFFTCLFIEKLQICLDNGGKNTDSEASFVADINNILTTVPSFSVRDDDSATVRLVRALLISIILRGEQYVSSRDSLPTFFNYIKEELVGLSFSSKEGARFFLEPILDMINEKSSALIAAGVPEADIEFVAKLVGDVLYE